MTDHGQQHHSADPVRLAAAQLGVDLDPLPAERDHGQQHDQGETVRAAQETAVRQVLERLTTIAGLQRQILAAEVVDAVLNAGGPTPDRARGYATAVARLLDVDRYRQWWRQVDSTDDDFVRMPDRRALARYLKAVGPGTHSETGEVHRVERRPDGVIAEEHTFTRKHLNELVIGEAGPETVCDRLPTCLRLGRCQHGCEGADRG